jgi:hypothetical protein
VHYSSRAEKVGRNDPCPCGSGSKYKRCCLAKHEAERRASPPGESEADDEEERLALQMAAFIEPLLRKGGRSPENLKKALTFGAMCWDLALLDSDQAREEALVEYAKGLGNGTSKVTDEIRATFRDLALCMVDRHREMFPELHAGRAQ